MHVITFFVLGVISVFVLNAILGSLEQIFGVEGNRVEEKQKDNSSSQSGTMMIIAILIISATIWYYFVAKIHKRNKSKKHARG